MVLVGDLLLPFEANKSPVEGALSRPAQVARAIRPPSCASSVVSAKLSLLHSSLAGRSRCGGDAPLHRADAGETLHCVSLRRVALRFFLSPLIRPVSRRRGLRRQVDRRSLQGLWVRQKLPSARLVTPSEGRDTPALTFSSPSAGSTSREWPSSASGSSRASTPGDPGSPMRRPR